MQPRESELAPESILPAQLSDRPFGGARVQPEKRLQVAVLADAVLTFHRWAGDEGARARRLFAGVETWFASDEADSPFTFMAICDSLKFDPIYIRRGLGGWRAHFEATVKPTRSVRRDSNGTQHRVVLSRLRRVA
jgi:hypothetical protein